MHAIHVTLLICAAHVPQADCQPETALDLIAGPEVATLGHCGFQGQAYLANSAVAQLLTADTYLKIQCSRRHAIVETEPPRPPTTVSIQR